MISWMPHKEYIRLRRDSAKKSLLADAIPDDLQDLNSKNKHGKLTRKGRREQRRALKQQMGNLTGLPPGSSIGLKFYQKPGIIDAMHLETVLEHNIEIWKKRLVERMEYMRYTNKCWKLLFWMMLLGYPSVAVKTLRTYSCIQVGSFRVLATDMAIECSGLTWMSYALFAAVSGGLVIVGVPFIFIYVLVLARDVGVVKIWKNCLRFPKRQEQLLREAKEDAEASGRYWTLDKDGDGSTTLSEKKDAIVTYLRRKNMRFHRTYQRLGFIYYSYREECWWYEIVELSRKLVLNAMMVLVSDNNAATRVSVGVGACFFYLLFMNYVRPYTCNSDFLLQNVCHLQLFLTVLCGLVLKANIPFLGFEPRWRPTEHAIIEVIVITSHVLTVVFALGTVIWEKFFSHEVRRVHARKQKATLDRKLRMKKWNRAKKAVLLGVRSVSTNGGLTSFGGLSIGTKNSKKKESHAALSIIGALGKETEKGSLTYSSSSVSEKEKEIINTSNAFAFPDDERDMSSSVINSGTDNESAAVAAAAHNNQSSHTDASDSSDDDSDSSSDENIDAAKDSTEESTEQKKTESATTAATTAAALTSGSSSSDDNEDSSSEDESDHVSDKKDNKKTERKEQKDNDKKATQSTKTKESEETKKNLGEDVIASTDHKSKQLETEEEKVIKEMAAIRDQSQKTEEDEAVEKKKTNEVLPPTMTTKPTGKAARLGLGTESSKTGSTDFAWVDESDTSDDDSSDGHSSETSSDEEE